MPSTVQSVLFPKNKYNLEEAAEWLILHGYKFKKVDITTNYLRCRQESPKKLKNDGYENYYTQKIKNGIILVIASKD